MLNIWLSIISYIDFRKDTLREAASIHKGKYFRLVPDTKAVSLLQLSGEEVV